MPRFLRATLLVFGITALLASRVAAQTIDPARVFLSGEIRLTSDSPLLSVGSRVDQLDRDQLDYSIFVHELAAFVTKEIFPDSADEYEGTSLIPSRLTTEPIEHRSQFGSHCLLVLSRIRFGLPQLPTFGMMSGAEGGSSSVPAYMARAGTALLAVRQVWSAFKNDVEDTRSGFSLHPKLSARKLGIHLTFHW